MPHPSIRNKIVSISLATGCCYIGTEKSTIKYCLTNQLLGEVVAAENSGTKFNQCKKDR